MMKWKEIGTDTDTEAEMDNGTYYIRMGFVLGFSPKDGKVSDDFAEGVEYLGMFADPRLAAIVHYYDPTKLELVRNFKNSLLLYCISHETAFLITAAYIKAGMTRPYLLAKDKSGHFTTVTWDGKDKIFEYGQGKYYGDCMSPDQIDSLYLLP